jgi:hypothetical protein
MTTMTERDRVEADLFSAAAAPTPARKRRVVTGTPPLPPPDELAWVRVDPVTAAAWLERNTHNRPAHDQRVGGMVRDMAGGAWVDTGEAVQFCQGQLVNGQKRLTAIVESGATIDLVVVPDVPPAALRVIDTVEARTLAQTLGVLGSEQPRLIGEAARLALTYERTGLVRGLWLTDQERLYWIERNPDINAAAAAAAQLRRRIKVRPAVLTFCIWRLRRCSGAADAFFNDVAELNTTGVGDPRAVLIRTLEDMADRVTRPKPAEEIAVVFTAWNHWRRGDKAVAKLRLDWKPAQDNPRKVALNIPDPVSG